MKKLIVFLFALCIINACNSNLENSSKKVNEKDIKSLKTKSGVLVKQIQNSTEFEQILTRYEYVVLFSQDRKCSQCKMKRRYYHYLAEKYTPMGYGKIGAKEYLGFTESFLDEFVPSELEGRREQHHYILIYKKGRCVAEGTFNTKESLDAMITGTVF